MNRALRGHILALFTVVVWGTTFIISKVLLRTFTPAEIILFRFSQAFLYENFNFLREKLFSPGEAFLYEIF